MSPILSAETFSVKTNERVSSQRMASRTDGTPLQDLPGYVRQPGPIALFTRLARVGLHLDRLQAEAMAPVGIAFGDYTLLATLRREPPPHRLPVSRLAELVLRPMGSITLIVDRLEGQGLVERRPDPDDRRRVLVGLTDSGASLADRGDDAYLTVRERVLARLDDDEVAAVDEAVMRLLDALEQG